MYCIVGSLAKILVVGLRVSDQVECERGEVFTCNIIGEVEGIGIARKGKDYVIYIRPTRILKENSLYRITGVQGRTLYEALKALSKLPLRRLIELAGTENVKLTVRNGEVALYINDILICRGSELSVQVIDNFITECNV